MYKKGDMMKCYLTGKDAAVIGVYASTRTLGNQSVGTRIRMECSAREDAKDCEYYERCMQRLKYLDTE
jgi:hypothetical protein